MASTPRRRPSSSPRVRRAAPAKAARKAPAKAASKAPGKATGGKKAPANRRSFLWRWRRGLFLVGLLLVAAIAGTGFVLASVALPPERFQAQTTFICAADVQAGCNQDNALAALHGEQDRVPVTLDQIPEVLVQAVLAAEDRDFFDHGGVDPVGIARAAYQDIRGGGLRQGGSTITQQYVSAVYLTKERTLTRKVKEAVLAIKVEQELSKEEILERYLNAVYFGRGAYGIGAASRTYFGHDVGQIDLAEAAYLAGLIRAPEAADAVRDPEEASRRRRTVLDGMLEEGYIDEAQYRAADSEQWIVLLPDGSNAATATILDRSQREGFGTVRDAQYGTEYFVEFVRQELQGLGFTDDEIYGGGLRVYTTLDLQAQRAAWEAVHSTLDETGDPPAALVAIDGSGYVRAMVGGENFRDSEFNYATGSGGVGRQAGSAMKPFVLATAVTQGISLNSRFTAPGSITIPRANAGRDWRVSNYSGTEQGTLTLLDATRVSSNTAYAQVMMEVGPEPVVELAHRMGIERALDPFPSLVLGAEEVSPFEMATAYNTFASDGLHVEPAVITRIERVEGSAITPARDREQVLTPEQNAQVVFALRQVVDRGTATAAKLGNAPAAGKTGTTDDNRDAWFIGFLPNGMTAAVWMGYDAVDTDGDGVGDETVYMDNVHGRAVTGGSFPAQIWRTFMGDWIQIAGTPVGSFTNVTTFPGRIVNDELELTSSTIVACGPDESSTTATTAPCGTTTTSSTTTSTTPPDSTTTSTPPSSTTTSSSTTTTSTTAPTTTEPPLPN